MPCALFKDFFTHITNNAPRVYKKEVNFHHLEHNPRNKTINMSTKTYILYILGASKPKAQVWQLEKPLLRGPSPPPLFAIVKSYYFTKPP